MRMYTFVDVVDAVVDDVVDGDVVDDNAGHQFLYAICTAHVAPRKPLSIYSTVVQRIFHQAHSQTLCCGKLQLLEQQCVLSSFYIRHWSYAW